MKTRYEGTCSVCGETYTWIRHYAKAPASANPKCAIYSSVIQETPA
jgi:hypothetical protein